MVSTGEIVVVMEKLTVIGLGKLGICNALIFERSGFDIFGVDLSQEYCDQLNNKEPIFEEPYVNEYLLDSQYFKASTSLSDGLSFSDTIFIVVDTPNGGEEEHYDHSNLTSLLKGINENRVSNKHLIICCTVMPGYITNTAKPLLRNCLNVSVNYNPEFIAQGNIIRSFENPDMVLIGEDSKEAGDVIQSIYEKACNNQPYFARVSPLEAEIAKIGVNGFITTKLSYANMIGDLCDNLGVDKNEVLQVIGSDSRIGNKYFRAGYSYGGPCFPRDTKALSKVLKREGISTILPDATGSYNELHIQYHVARMLQSDQEVFVIEDVCFKENCPVSIIEESAKLKIASILVKQHGKKIIIKDREAVIDMVKAEYSGLFEYEITN